MAGLHVTRDAMEYISFITVQSGDDLVVSFAIQGLDPSGTRNPVFRYYLRLSTGWLWHQVRHHREFEMPFLFSSG